MIRANSVDDIIKFNDHLNRALSQANLKELTTSQSMMLRGLLAGNLFSPGNAPDVANRLAQEFHSGKAAKDWQAWGREALTTMARLLS